MSTRRDFWPAELEQLVDHVTYKQGWTVRLGEEFADDGAGGLKLFIVSVTPDSYQPDRTIAVRHEFLVPRASYSRDVWAAWLFDRYRDVETHEAGESSGSTASGSSPRTTATARTRTACGTSVTTLTPA